MKIRLQKYIRDCTGISRRKAEEEIEHGHVVMNGMVATLGNSVDTTQDVVLFHGKKLTPQKEEKITIMLHKPKRVVTTRSDPQKRKTVFDLLPKHLQHLFPIGRLDYDTEGLLLLTNDGDLAYRLTHPKFEVEKEYVVTVDGFLSDQNKKEIEKGLHTISIKTSHAKIQIISRSQKQTILHITIHEGQNREIRRIFEVFSLPVLSLKRIRIQNILLGNLPRGKWKELPGKRSLT
jgi:pseudouridine synthase